MVATDANHRTKVLRVVEVPDRALTAGEEDQPRPTVASVSGCLDSENADVLAHEVIDLVFALPPTDVVLDLRDVDVLCPEGAETIRNAQLALADQGAHLTVLCPPDLELALEDTGVDLDFG